MSVPQQKHTVSPLAGEDKATIRAEAFRAQFMYEFSDKKDITLANKLGEFLKRKGWNRSKLANKAHLETKECYRIFSGEIKKPKMEIILCLSLALQLSAEERDLLVTLADINWDSCRLYKIYRYIFEKGYTFLGDRSVQTIDEFNDAFLALQIEGYNEPPLGDRPRK